MPYQIFGAGNAVETHLRRYDPRGNVLWDVPAVAWMMAASNRSGPATVVGNLSAGSTSVLGKSLSCSSDHCLVIGQLDDDGAFAWARIYESAGSVAPEQAAVASDGRIVIIGEAFGTVDFGAGPIEADPAGIVAAFGPTGDPLWTRPIQTSAPSCQLMVDSLAVGPSGEVAIGGLVCDAADSIDFGSGTVAGPGSDPAGYTTSFFAKLDAEGNLVFGRLASPGTFGQNRLAFTSSGEIVLSAGLNGVIDLGGGPVGTPGGSQRVLAKLSPTGDVLWSRTVASSSKELGASWMTVDATDHIWTAPAIMPGMTFQGAPIVSMGENDALLLEYAPSGDELAKWQFAAAKLEGISAVAVADNGDPVIAGQLLTTIDFGQGPLVSAGGPAVFVAKLVP